MKKNRPISSPNGAQDDSPGQRPGSRHVTLSSPEGAARRKDEDDDEIRMTNDDLPEGWAKTTLDDIARDVTYGYTAKSNRVSGGAKMLRITDIQDNRVNWNTVPYCAITPAEKSKYLLKKWDLVFARTGATVGKSFLIQDEVTDSVYASYLIRVRCLNHEMTRYLSFFFNSRGYWDQITDFSAGIGQPNVNGTKLKALSIPLAPLAEQKRIADKLESVLGRVDACRARLDRVPALLKRFRQSVLAAATCGKLTEDWRKETGGNSKLQENELPVGWTKTKLEEVASDVTYGYTAKSNRISGGAKMLRITDIQDNRVDWNTVPFCAITPDEKSKYLLKKWDLVFARTGATVGKSFLIQEDVRDSVYASYLIRVRCLNYEITRYLSHFLNSPGYWDQITDFSAGIGQPNVNGTKLKALVIPLPPLPEQQEIVRRVEALFAFADRIESRLATGQKTVERLTPATLAKAFRGELVPQDPSDEPAAALLERLRSQPAAKTAKAKRVKRP